MGKRSEKINRHKSGIDVTETIRRKNLHSFMAECLLKCFGIVRENPIAINHESKARFFPVKFENQRNQKKLGKKKLLRIVQR
jgi:hypothetical protein